MAAACIHGSTGRKHRRTEELVDWLAKLDTKRVPQRQVNRGNGLNHEALAAIVDRPTPHLVPHELNVANVLALHEASQVIFNDETCGNAADSHADANDARHEFYFYDDGAKRVDTPYSEERGMRYLRRSWCAGVVVT